MVGLLDSKKRILDTIVTSEGRRQMAQGALEIRFATFTDQDAFYEFDAISGTTDASARPHLEAFSRPQDTITFESDDVGNLVQAPGGNFSVIAGHVLVPKSGSYVGFPTAAQRKTQAYSLLSATFDSFQQLYAISNGDLLDDVNEFNLSAESIAFDITDDLLMDGQGIATARVEDIESLFQDRRLSHAPNFRYLPPENMPTPEHPEGTLLGEYPRIDQGELLTYDELVEDLEDAQRIDVNFSETSKESNLFGQLFDVRAQKTLKLDIIDFGEFIASDGGSRHVFFAGRIFRDARGSHTYVNIFTLVFS